MQPCVLYAFTDRDGFEKLEDIGAHVVAQGGPKNVELVQVGQLAALIGPQTKRRLLHSSDHNKNLRLHHYQTVLEVAMEEASVLPARFQTLLPNPEAASALLQRYRQPLEAALHDYGELIEFEISIKWDIGEIVRNILSQDGLSTTQGSAAQALEDTIQEKRRDLGAYIRNAFDSIALDVIDVRTTAQDDLCHHVLLLDKSREATLFDLLKQIDKCGIGKVSTLCIGPLPPCSFASIDLWNSDADAVEAARKSLDLDTIVDGEEIRKAYHLALKAHHPDLNEQATSDPETISSLREAFELLSMIADGQADIETSPEDGVTQTTVRLDSDSLKETLLLSLYRAGQQTHQAA
jgi:DNA-binding transcriptional ArsR family regulator